MSGGIVPIEVEFLTLSSKLERAKEYASYARRRAAAAAQEARFAEEDALRKANELEAMRAEWLRRAA